MLIYTCDTMKKFLFASVFFITTLVCAQEESFQKAIEVYHLGKYEVAYSIFADAGDAFRLADRYYDYASCNLNMASCLMALQQFEDGFTLAKNSLTYIDDVLGSDSLLSAQALFIMGSARQKQLRYKDALLHLYRADSLYPDNTVEKALCNQSLGLSHEMINQKEEAIRYYGLALQHIDTANIIFGDLLVSLARLNQNPGSNLEKALRIYINDFGQDHPKVMNCYAELGIVYASRNNSSRAMEAISSSERIGAIILPEQSPERARILLAKGKVLLELQQFEDAIHAFESVLKIHLRFNGEKSTEIARLHYLLGRSFEHQNLLLEADLSYHEAINANTSLELDRSSHDLPTVSTFFDPNLGIQSVMAHARVLERIYHEKSTKKQNLEHALVLYTRAIEFAERLFWYDLIRFDHEGFELHLFEAFENALRLSLILSELSVQKDQYLNNAHDLIQRGRTYQLKKSLSKVDTQLNFGIPSGLSRFEDSLKHEWTILQHRLTIGNPILTDNLKSLDNISISLDSIEHQYSQRFSEYYNTIVSNTPPSLLDLQNVINAETAVLSYFTGNSALFISMVDRQSLRVIHIPIEDTFVKSLATYRNSLVQMDVPVYEQTALALHQRLIPAIDNDITSMIIIPDQSLEQIPFETFKSIDKSKKSRYLIERYAVSYALSMTSLYQYQLNQSNTEDGLEFIVAPERYTSTLPALGNDFNIELKKGGFRQFANTVNPGNPGKSTILPAWNSGQEGNMDVIRASVEYRSENGGLTWIKALQKAKTRFIHSWDSNHPYYWSGLLVYRK